MARVLGLLGSALNAARGGATFAAWERQVRALGLGARETEMRALFKYAQGIVNNSRDDPFANQNAAPTDQVLTPWPTRNATGVKQTVTILYRDRTTGQIVHTYYSVVTDQGISRQAAIEQATGAYEDAADRYKQDLIGAVHTGAYQLTPAGF